MRKKVLIVDDAVFVREMLKNIINQNDLFIFIGEAENGEEAILLTHQLQPDIIIMDVSMPLKNGPDATKEILEKNPNVKIIACTSIDQEDIVFQALEAGCVDFIKKPFTTEDVIKALTSIGYQNQKKVI